MTTRSGNSETFLAFAQRFRAAADAGLAAAGAEYWNTVDAKLAQGYTTGRFTTGESAREVEVTPPFDHADGRAVAVGTDDENQRRWELGHYNIFERRWVRVEHWRTALVEAGPRVAAAFRAAFIARMAS